MFLYLACFYIKQVESVLVGSYPYLIALVGAEAADAVLANHVAVAQSGTHIVEVVLQESLHENAFLQHTYPDIALLVFQDAGNLALGEVDESAEERILLSESGAWIIYIDAQSVASDEEAAVSADVDIIYRQVSDRSIVR